MTIYLRLSRQWESGHSATEHAWRKTTNRDNCKKIRTMITRRAIAFALAATTLACAQAQTADTAKVVAKSGQWTLQECIDYALANNIDVKSGELTLEQSEVSVESATGQLMPTLSFSTNHNVGWRPLSQNTVALSGGTMTSTQNDVTYSGNYALQANWTVWDGGRTRRERQSYKLDVEKARNTNDQTATTIEEQIVQYYVQILYEADAARVADSTLATSTMLRDRGKAMVDAGQLAKVDLAQLEAQMSQDQYSLVSALTQVANYKMQLRQILEIIKSSDFDVAIPELSDEKILAALPTIDDVYAAALETRPEMKNALISIEQADIQERIARGGHYPTISLSAGVSTGHNSADDTSVGTQIKQNVNNSIGLSINVPILDNRQTRTNRSKAKIQRRQSELDQRDAENKIYQQVETYWLNAQSAQMQYQAAVANERSMQESFDLVSEQFRLGLKNIAELTQGKSNLLTAQQQRLQSKYTALLNIALLKFYAGEELAL